MAEGNPPKGMDLTTAPKAYGYNSPGEMSDWIMAATGIPAVSPEIGTTDPRSETFFIKEMDVIVDVLDQNYPLVHSTFRKIGYQLKPELLYTHELDDELQSVTLMWHNKGLSDSNDHALLVIKSDTD